MSDNAKGFFDLKIDPKFTKKVRGAGKQDFVSIDAYYLFEVATQKMGLLGDTWGLINSNYEDVHLQDGTILRRLSATFFHTVDKENGVKGMYPISVMEKFVYQTKNGYQMVNTDVDKMLFTHALSKGLSYLGFGSQVYKGLFDSDTYIANAYQDAQVQKEMEAVTEKQKEEIVFLMNETKSDETKMLSFVKIDSLDDLTVAKYEVLKQALFAKKQKGESK